MATSSTAAPQRHKPLVRHETVHRPWTNPNRRDAAAAAPSSHKSRIRDIERRLRLEALRASKVPDLHVHEQRRQKEARLPADKQRDYERELVELIREDAIREADKKRNAVMKRYKKVKFVESKKAERRWRAAQRALQESDDADQQKNLEHALHVAEVDKNYVKYCPLGWVYVSLYASKDKDDAVADGWANKGDAEMWQRVEQAMTRKGELDRLKNELVISLRTPEALQVQDEKQVEDDEGSDGDFFE